MNVLDVLLDEGMWFPMATLIALIAVAVLVLHYRTEAVSRAIIFILRGQSVLRDAPRHSGLRHLFAAGITTAMGTSTGRWFLFPLASRSLCRHGGWWLQ